MNLTEREFYDQGERLGLGFDSFQEKFLSAAIDCGDENEEELRKKVSESPLESLFSFEHIHDEFELCKSFSISGSISGNALFGHVGMLSGQARANYFSNKNINVKNLCILLNYQIKNRAYRIQNPKLSDSAKNFLNSQGPEEFIKKFGDEFIIGFRTGAEYTALIEVFSQEINNQEQTYLDIKATLSSILYQVEASGNHENKSTDTLNQLKTNILCYKKGSKISEKGIVLNLEQMIQDFTSFQKGLKETGGIEYTAIFAEYDQLEEIQKKPILTRELSELKHYVNLLRLQRLKHQEELFDWKNQLKFQKASKNTDIDTKIKHLKDKIYQIDSYIRECYQAPNLIEPQILKKYLE
ncbi:MAG: hypothetical protein ACFKPT_13635 [Gloeotrichia echinulata GP01]